MEKEKEKLRAAFIAQRDALAADDIRNMSMEIERRFFELDEYKSSKTIMFYVSKGSEVFTHSIIKNALKRGKSCSVPYCGPEGDMLVPAKIKDFGDLVRGRYGVLQPSDEAVSEIEPRLIDMFIVPGVVFDRSGLRIGWGKGYYDRFLGLNAPDKPKVGLAYDLQVINNIKNEEAHDVSVDIIITQKEEIRSKDQRPKTEDCRP
ncbi:5-formyltetrahydrofolate cyclo-ligase [Candidatus Auribacterota bacterium]